jgi:sialate O-acetylesterase
MGNTEMRKTGSNCKTCIVTLAILIITADWWCDAMADIRLPSIISDNMIIQENANVPIWGRANAGEQITVSILTQKHTTSADANGQWRVVLKPLVSKTPLEMEVQGKNTIKVKQILVGEVWLASGQSNMHLSLPAALNGPEEVKNAKYPEMRFFMVSPIAADKPAADCNGRWLVCSPEVAGNFSAVAYFFACDLYKELNCPIGIIAAPCGGSFIEAWMSEKALQSTPDYAVIMNRYGAEVKKYNELTAQYQQKLEQWQKEKNAEVNSNQPIQPKPELPIEITAMPRNSPSRLFNAMIHPLIPYAIKGVIWYQGESNALAGRSYQYGRLFPAMLNDWRSCWGYDFPFYSVQLTSFANNPWQSDDSNNPDWAEMREIQLKMSLLKNSGMVVTVDIGEANNIHPTNKQEVGRRLALIALAKDYGKHIVYAGPVFDSMKIKGNAIILTFTHADGGLVMKGKQLEEFVICGSDWKFVKAKAQIIDRNHVAVYNDQIEKPIAVRYGWRRCPVNCNLYNSDGLPASPFRTDHQPYLSLNEK